MQNNNIIYVWYDIQYSGKCHITYSSISFTLPSTTTLNHSATYWIILVVTDRYRSDIPRRCYSDPYLIQTLQRRIPDTRYDTLPQWYLFYFSRIKQQFLMKRRDKGINIYESFHEHLIILDFKSFWLEMKDCIRKITVELLGVKVKAVNCNNFDKLDILFLLILATFEQ